jgi:hypothetical protein
VRHLRASVMVEGNEANPHVLEPPLLTVADLLSVDPT